MEELKVKFLMGPPDCNDPHIPEYSENYLKELGKVLGIPVVCREIEEVKKQALSVYFIASGGAEPGFKEVYKQVEEPYILLTTPAYNSLAAAMEIMGFYRNKDWKERFFMALMKKYPKDYIYYCGQQIRKRN